jgi:16S rRNA (guanine966-N2)-methyltransferase
MACPTVAEDQMPRTPPAGAPTRGHVRIIGGAWRGRRIEFDAVEGLRPTPDRVRETLFNWLQPLIEGSRCLDLFCGTGALGLEALSRGAALVHFVDRSPQAIAALRNNMAALRAVGAQPSTADVFAWLAKPAGTPRFDIAFVDPPYRHGLVPRSLALLAVLLEPGARVYVEMAADEPPPPLPEGWIPYRDKRAGQVAYRLFVAGAG